MITRRTSLFALLSALLLGAGFGRAALAPDDKDKQPAKPTAEEIQMAAKAIKDKFEPLKNADDKLLVPITDEAVARALPGRVVYAVVFPQYPVARLAPEPLKLQNVFVVDADGKVEQITDAKGLEKSLRGTLAPVKDDGAAKDAAQAWLRLSEELHQDKFFQFSIPEKDLAVEKEKDGRKATGKAVVEPKGGNQGQIEVTLLFDADGKLVKADEKAELKAGIRPICQATKLLDADPIVRRMAEQDILVMGRVAKPYLDEQRAKAAPELQKAIDRIWQRILDEGR
jgi:hypothetical protein